MIWHALYTRPQRELSSAQDLRADGYTIEVPCEIVTSKCRYVRRAKERYRPLIPGYVFVADALPTLSGDLVGYLMTNGAPARISDEQMQPVFRLNGRLAPECVPPPPRQLTIGQVITFPSGVAVTIGRFVGNRVEVITRLFGHDTTTTVPRHQLEAIL